MDTNKKENETRIVLLTPGSYLYLAHLSLVAFFIYFWISDNSASLADLLPQLPLIVNTIVAFVIYLFYAIALNTICFVINDTFIHVYHKPIPAPLFFPNRMFQTKDIESASVKEIRKASSSSSGTGSLVWYNYNLNVHFKNGKTRTLCTFRNAQGNDIKEKAYEVKDCITKYISENSNT